MTERDLDRLLLEVATTLGGELRLDELARKLRVAWELLPKARLGGLAIRDRERGLVRGYSLDLREPKALLNGQWTEPEASRRDIEGDSDADERLARKLLEEAGRGRIGECAAAPLVMRDANLGTVFVAFEGSDPVSSPIRSYLKRLAGILTPIVWNCFTHERFSRGDARRDALVALGRAINQSLQVETVISLAQRAIRQLDGHCWSWIGLLEKECDTFRRFNQYRDDEEEALAAGPEPLPVAGSVLEWLLESGEAYESGDLRHSLRFEEDEVASRRGVRRYVATPMYARGKIAGGFFFGSEDPHPALHMDRWLYENIAIQLALSIDNAMKHEQLLQLSARQAIENVYLRKEIQSEHNSGEMIGRSPAMQRVREAIARVAPTDSTVLISGATGVGKELVARAIHAASTRAQRPMVKINCAAIPEAMVESELFGHERGAFTSAVDRHIGRFELAHEGTLFLDEIGEIPLAVQAKLLRVLQDGEFERVGGTETISSQARIIAASNRDLSGEIKNGAFRSDLYYRLNVFPIEVASLEERRSDIPLLVEAFVLQLSRRMGKRIESIDADSLEALCHRNWPGNIRELRHVIERAIILADGPCLVIADADPSRPTVPKKVPPAQSLETLKEIQADHIRRALERTRGVIEGPNGAAEILGLKPSTLRFRMKRLGVTRRSD
ncbi:MAG: sigma 54-interacting transcriptional regulator [Planctomycetota bacterium]